MNAAPILPTHRHEPATAVVEAVAGRHWTDAADLLDDYVEWMRSAAGFDPFTVQPDFAGEIADLAAEYGRSDRALFLAYRSGVAVGTVAVWIHDGGAAELKRRFVRPSARRRGVADTLIGTAIAHATASGCRHLWLESVSGAMDPAIAAYQRHGFGFADGQQPTLAIHGVVVLRRRLGAR